MSKTLYALVILCLFLQLSTNGQEMWGIRNSNYSGCLGLSLNPSTIVGAPYKYDINIFTLDIFLQNNLAYIPASDKVVYRAFEGSSQSPTAVVDSYSSSKKSAFIHAQINGPSFVWSEDKTSSWAFHTEFRTEGTVLKVPYGLNTFGEQNFNFFPSVGQKDYDVPSFSAAAMSWMEAGITYGRVYSNHEKDYWKWAVTMNLEEGFEGMYASVKKLNYSTTDSTTIVQNMNGAFAHSISPDFLSSRGWGLGTTIGVTYVNDRSQRAFALKRAADGLQKYKYRIGFSLMDIGFIRFNNDVETAVINSTTPSQNINNLPFGSFQSFDTTLVNRIGGSVNNKPFNIWLPMAGSVQFDYALSPHWYANASLVNRIHFIPNEIARGDQFVTSLRYEQRNFEFAINLNLFEYNSLSSGFCFRYRSFIFGTDRLSQILSINNLNAVNLYFGFKINFTEQKHKNVRAHSCPAYKAS